MTPKSTDNFIQNWRRLSIFYLIGIVWLLPAVSFAQLSPDQLYGDLFHQVQLQGIFEDSKTFPDCIPLYPADQIQKKYQQQRKKKDFNLATFVEQNFRPPVQPETNFVSDTTRSVTEHINRLWPLLNRQPDSARGSLIPLPHPYIVPGGRFREIYYWDSYFTMLGLQVAGKTDLIENMVDNFTYLINTFGFIPNGNRTYYLSRSQPPFYSLMVKLLAESKDSTVFIHYLPALEKEYQFWMDGAATLTPNNAAFRRVVRLPDGEILNRYWDDRPSPRPESYREDVELAKGSGRSPEEVYRNIRAACESGWDFSSRWFADKKNLATIQTTQIIPVDLNSLLYHLELTLSQAHRIAGNSPASQKYREQAQKRASALLKYCWNPEVNFFMDYNFHNRHSTEVFSMAALYPLFFHIATPEQAKAVAWHVEEKFLQPGGLVTTIYLTKQQWDAPNGWAPLQWIGIQGLSNYDYRVLAEKTSYRWIDLNRNVYQRTGKLMEKYNVMDIGLLAGGGEYPNQDGFGWTNGVLLKLISLRADLPSGATSR